jgi:hypothetical protein
MCDLFNVDVKIDVQSGDCSKDGYAKLISYTWVAADNCGNTSEFKLFVQLIDDVKPYFTPNAVEINVDCEAKIPAVKAYDDCSTVKMEVERNRVEGNCPGNYTVTEKYVATDACGNSAEFSRVVNVEDKTGHNLCCEGCM